MEKVSRDKEEGERAAERSAEGRRVSAITSKTGAEKSSKEINMLIKKNTVLRPLKTLLDFSSLEIKNFEKYPILCTEIEEEEGESIDEFYV